MNYARWDLCGGRPAMGVSTAIQILTLSAAGPERLRAFRSCPLITSKDPCSSLQMLAIARYGCALRLDQVPFGVLLGHARNTLSL